MSDKALVKQLQKEVTRLESELRNPGLPVTSCDYAAMSQKKNLQIGNMDREIRELIKQRDLAQSLVEDLLRMVGNDQKSSKFGSNSMHCPASFKPSGIAPSFA
ncbi:hypothetical protein Fmac_008602 [Flemingia macrophylla]|uniref:Uncharacterized protein n=1 Tax=Flemingia macrophylla TaxID=520843 RepID=A0ABD1MXU3_9FABA